MFLQSQPSKDIDISISYSIHFSWLKAAEPIEIQIFGLAPEKVISKLDWIACAEEGMYSKHADYQD